MLSQTVEYALRAMMHLAGVPGASVSSESIARQTRVPPGYLSKIMRHLVVADLVTSARGPRGGFALARDPGAISILDVVNAVDPTRRVSRLSGGDPLHNQTCALRRRVGMAIAAMELCLQDTTLAELVPPRRL